MPTRKIAGSVLIPSTRPNYFHPLRCKLFVGFLTTRRFEVMKRRLLFLFVLLTLLSGLTLTFTNVAHAETRTSSSCVTPGGTNTLQGNLGGTNYIIAVPANWNGTLVLYSHGYVFPGQPNPAKDAADPVTGAALLQQGYALAGSAYSATGWA